MCQSSDYAEANPQTVHRHKGIYLSLLPYAVSLFRKGLTFYLVLADWDFQVLSCLKRYNASYVDRQVVRVVSHTYSQTRKCFFQ